MPHRQKASVCAALLSVQHRPSKVSTLVKSRYGFVVNPVCMSLLSFQERAVLQRAFAIYVTEVRDEFTTFTEILDAAGGLSMCQLGH